MRVDEVRLARAAHLSAMLAGGEDVRLLEQFLVEVRLVGLDLVEDVFEADHRTDLRSELRIEDCGIEDAGRGGRARDVLGEHSGSRRRRVADPGAPGQNIRRLYVTKSKSCSFHGCRSLDRGGDARFRRSGAVEDRGEPEPRVA